MTERIVVTLFCAVLLGAPLAHGGGVADTVHNLSASGPGSVRAPSVREVCIFCHTPHRAGRTPLWNRDLPAVTYRLYESSTVGATIKQPTGVSRLCLSCHDGTTALGNLRVPPRTGAVALGPLTGRTSVGTDLSDDHPVSFVFDAALALRQGQLAEPSALPRTLPLEKSSEMQCTTCHDPHDDRYRKFLRMDDRAAGLCLGCHQQRNWSTSSHATSPARWRGTGPNPWPTTPYTTVADNGCASCHRSHAAPHPARLLAAAEERGVCLVCHGGSVAVKNLEAEFLKPSAHPIASSEWTHDPREDPASMRRHVTCVDCHNPHQAAGALRSSPGFAAPLRGVRGVNVSGVSTADAAQEYEVCLKCHGVRDEVTAGIVRADSTRNIRLKISTSNASYHPIASVGRSPIRAGFEAGISAGMQISCIDCHNNDEWTQASGRPRGSHGSRYAPILERNYDTGDPSAESYQSYATCYKCHNRDFLIGDRAGTFPHRKHVVDQQAPCAACHDAHGSRQNPRLINFMLNDRTGRAVVSRSTAQRRLEFVAQGPGRGQCYLLCHGRNHEPATYP